MRPGDGGGGRKGAVHVGKNGARQEGIAGEEREAGKTQIASGDKVLIEAQEKVRKGTMDHHIDDIGGALLLDACDPSLPRSALLACPSYPHI